MYAIIPPTIKILAPVINRAAQSGTTVAIRRMIPTTTISVPAANNGTITDRYIRFFARNSKGWNT